MSRNAWRLIRSGFLSGALNMALDEALLESVAAGESPPVLRLYRWAPPTVTLGYAQRGPNVVNLQACRELGLDVVRRATGGRAVLHDREVTYAVVSPERNAVFPGGIAENYQVIAEVLKATLASFGVATELAAGRRQGAKGEGAQQSACFTAPSICELVHRGCKMTGGAQKRQGGAFLQHGSIPVDLDLEKLFRALNTVPGRSPERATRILAKSVGWLNRWAPSPAAVAEVENRLVEAFSQVLDLDLQKDQVSPAEWRRARVLEKSRYADSRWNLYGVAS